MSPPDGETLPTASDNQTYFRVRVGRLTAPQALAHGVGVASRAIADLAWAPVSASDMSLETTALCSSLVLFGEAAGGLLGGECPAPKVPLTQALAPAERWIVGHHVRFLIETCAAASLWSAAMSVSEGDISSAVTRISAATACVRGLPAAVAHACAMPRGHYRGVIRPGMAPPALDSPLSGRQHHTYKDLRRAIRQLLKVLPETHHALAARSRELAYARNQLLHADLIDAERHISFACTMVTTSRSLAQPAGSPIDAVTELRHISHVRAATYAPLLDTATVVHA